jgi:predicted metal-dependent peptidase
MAKQRLKEAIKEAASEAAGSAKGWGSISGQVKKEIIKRLETKVDWKKVLRYFIKTSQRSNRSASVKRINRRYAYIHPGKKVNRQAKIAVAIDQSGSVSDSMLEAFFAELNKLSNLASFTVVPFDTEVDPSKVYEWKKGQNKKAERVMCGGTCFEAPTKWANENSVDGLIILTDMEAPKPGRCKAQRLWLTDERGASRPYFKTNERVIPIDVPNN